MRLPVVRLKKQRPSKRCLKESADRLLRNMHVRRPTKECEENIMQFLMTPLRTAPQLTEKLVQADTPV